MELCFATNAFKVIRAFKTNLFNVTNVFTVTITFKFQLKPLKRISLMSSRKLVLKTLKTIQFLLKNDKCSIGPPFKSNGIFHRIYSVLASQLSGLNYIFYAPRRKYCIILNLQRAEKTLGAKTE